MRLLAPIVENPWCLVLMVLLIMLIVGGALIVAQAERARAALPGYPPESFPTRRLASSAPLEALAALHGRLLDLQRRLPGASDDARWLRSFTVRLRAAMDEAYARLDDAPPAQQGALLDRLASEVEAFAGVVNLQLSDSLTQGTDRQALEAQLNALRESLR